MRARSPFRDARPGVKDENIDRQILAIHCAIGNKMVQHPQLAGQVQEKVQQRYSQGKMRHSAYLTWSSLLEFVHTPDKFLAALLEDSPKMRRLRRQTPFVGILNEKERQDALLKHACGELDQVITS